MFHALPFIIGQKRDTTFVLDCTLVYAKHLISRSELITLVTDTASPRFTVILFAVNSQLRYLVITTLDSIYGKKNAEKFTDTVSMSGFFTLFEGFQPPA